MVTQSLRPRARKVKILATLGPASSSPEMVRRLMQSGADAFRINMSHGEHKQKAELVEAIRALEKELKRPTTILFDLQGPKLRVGDFKGGSAEIEKGAQFVLDRNRKLGDSTRVELPHPELFEAVNDGDRLLIDDGKVRLKVLEFERRAHRHRGPGRRARVEPQGRQRARRGGADPGADREGPRRPGLRARAESRLDRLVVRAAARGCRRGARADRRESVADGQDREAGGDRPA